MFQLIPPIHGTLPFMVGYLGPDTLLPLGSALAAIVGVILLFGSRLLNLGRSAVRRMRGQAPDAGPKADDTAAADLGNDTKG